MCKHVCRDGTCHHKCCIHYRKDGRRTAAMNEEDLMSGTGYIADAADAKAEAAAARADSASPDLKAFVVDDDVPASTPPLLCGDCGELPEACVCDNENSPSSDSGGGKDSEDLLADTKEPIKESAADVVAALESMPAAGLLSDAAVDLIVASGRLDCAASRHSTRAHNAVSCACVALYLR